MSEESNLSFLSCSDPDVLSEEDREAYLTYWASRTVEERFCEMFRLNVVKWDLKPPYRMDKTRIRVVDMSKYRHENS